MKNYLMIIVVFIKNFGICNNRVKSNSTVFFGISCDGIVLDSLTCSCNSGLIVYIPCMFIFCTI